MKMRKVIDPRGVVHFTGARAGLSLCGRATADCDLLGEFDRATQWQITNQRVNCPDCARVYTDIKNMPYNAIVPSICLAAVYEWGNDQIEEVTK